MAVQDSSGSKSDLLLRIVDEQNIETALSLVRDVGHYTNVVYHMAYRTNSPTDMPFFKSTYPPQWLGHYVLNQYQEIDPVFLQGFERVEPFFWSDLDLGDEKVAAFFEDAEKHGAGRNGFSIPLIDKAKRKAIFTVTSDLPEKDWKLKIDTEKTSLEQIGDVLHRKAILQIYGTDEGPSLAPREIECLYWTAQGKDVVGVAYILNISNHTARDYLKSARMKLGCRTIAQAIHLATKRRLINL